MAVEAGVEPTPENPRNYRRPSQMTRYYAEMRTKTTVIVVVALRAKANISTTKIS